MHTQGHQRKKLFFLAPIDHTATRCNVPTAEETFHRGGKSCSGNSIPRCTAMDTFRRGKKFSVFFGVSHRSSFVKSFFRGFWQNHFGGKCFSLYVNSLFYYAVCRKTLSMWTLVIRLFRSFYQNQFCRKCFSFSLMTFSICLRFLFLRLRKRLSMLVHPKMLNVSNGTNNPPCLLVGYTAARHAAQVRVKCGVRS